MCEKGILWGRPFNRWIWFQIYRSCSYLILLPSGNSLLVSDNNVHGESCCCLTASSSIIYFCHDCSFSVTLVYLTFIVTVITLNFIVICITYRNWPITSDISNKFISLRAAASYFGSFYRNMCLMQGHYFPFTLLTKAYKDNSINQPNMHL